MPNGELMGGGNAILQFMQGYMQEKQRQKTEQAGQQIPPGFEPTTVRREGITYKRPEEEGPLKKKKLSAVQRKTIGAIRRLKDLNAPVKDIIQYIAYEGLDPEEYMDEIGDYVPSYGVAEEKAKATPWETGDIIPWMESPREEALKTLKGRRGEYR